MHLRTRQIDAGRERRLRRAGEHVHVAKIQLGRVEAGKNVKVAHARRRTPSNWRRAGATGTGPSFQAQLAINGARKLCLVERRRCRGGARERGAVGQHSAVGHRHWRGAKPRGRRRAIGRRKRVHVGECERSARVDGLQIQLQDATTGRRTRVAVDESANLRRQSHRVGAHPSVKLEQRARGEINAQIVHKGACTTARAQWRRRSNGVGRHCIRVARRRCRNAPRSHHRRQQGNPHCEFEASY